MGSSMAAIWSVQMFGQQNVSKRAHDQVSGAGGGAGSGEDGSSQLHPDKRVKFSEDVVGDGGSSGGGSAGGGGTAHAAVEAELTEALVREFFTARGGRVIVSDVKDVSLSMQRGIYLDLYLVSMIDDMIPLLASSQPTPSVASRIRLIW